MELLAYLGGVRRGWVYAARVPKRRSSTTMAASFDRFLKDKEMIAHFKKAIGFQLVSLNAPAAQSIIDKVVEIQKRDPEALEILKAMAQEALNRIAAFGRVLPASQGFSLPARRDHP